MTSTLKGKRKRPVTEVDSDAESVGSNFQGHNILSNMNKLQCGILSELIKCRLRICPYDNVHGWNDKDLWAKLMCNLHSKGFLLSKDAIMDTIVDLEKIFLNGSSRNLGDNDFWTYLSMVFGPNYDHGPLITHELQWSFLPSTSTVTCVAEISSSNEDEDYAGEWLETKRYYTKEKKAIEVHDATEEEMLEKRKEQMLSRAKDKKKETKRQKVVQYTIPGVRYNPPDPSNPHPGRYFMQSNVTRVDETVLVNLYCEDTKHLPGDEIGRLLFNISPVSSEYQTMARLSPESRKAAFNTFQHLSKKAPVQQRSTPYFPNNNQHDYNV